MTFYFNFNKRYKNTVWCAVCPMREKVGRLTVILKNAVLEFLNDFIFT